MINNYFQKCSISPAIREMQIKITLRYHLTSVRVAIIKKYNNGCWSDVERETKSLLMGCKKIQQLQKSVWKFLQKIKSVCECTHICDLTISVLNIPRELHTPLSIYLHSRGCHCCIHYIK